MITNHLVTLLFIAQVMGTETPLSAKCQVRLALGAVTALSNQDFGNIESTYLKCPDLVQSTLTF